MKKQKRLYFRKWVAYLLGMVDFGCVLVLASEVENLKDFFISKLVALLIFIVISHLLVKYTKQENI
jgi:uncharacterized membrane protein SirB2